MKPKGPLVMRRGTAWLTTQGSQAKLTGQKGRTGSVDLITDGDNWRTGSGSDSGLEDTMTSDTNQFLEEMCKQRALMEDELGEDSIGRGDLKSPAVTVTVPADGEPSADCTCSKDGRCPKHTLDVSLLSRQSSDGFTHPPAMGASLIMNVRKGLPMNFRPNSPPTVPGTVEGPKPILSDRSNKEGLSRSVRFADREKDPPDNLEQLGDAPARGPRWNTGFLGPKASSPRAQLFRSGRFAHTLNLGDPDLLCACTAPLHHARWCPTPTHCFRRSWRVYREDQGGGQWLQNKKMVAWAMVIGGARGLD